MAGEACLEAVASEQQQGLAATRIEGKLPRHRHAQCDTLDKDSPIAEMPQNLFALRSLLRLQITLRISGSARAMLISKSARPPTPLHAVVRCILSH